MYQCKKKVLKMAVFFGSRSGGPLVEGDLQILISPPTHRPPQPPGKGCGDEALVPINMVTNAVGVTPKHPPMLRACGLVQFRRGALSHPPSFPAACQVACLDKDLVWILGGTPTSFFLNILAQGLPLIFIPDPKGLVMDWGGAHAIFFQWILSILPGAKLHISL
ncbi:hypothetical protein AB205_0138300, partial [Aquarana catesbeiana]